MLKLGLGFSSWGEGFYWWHITLATLCKSVVLCALHGNRCAFGLVYIIACKICLHIYVGLSWCGQVHVRGIYSCWFGFAIYFLLLLQANCTEIFLFQFIWTTLCFLLSINLELFADYLKPHQSSSLMNHDSNL